MARRSKREAAEAEYALRLGSGPQKPLPLSPASLQEQVFATTYAASYFWNRLALLLDPADRMSLPTAVAHLAYVDGSRVVHDDELHGAAFMKALLESLASLDRDIGAQRGWSAYQWKEADQRSARHDAEIFGKIQSVVCLEVRRAGLANSPELDAFLALTLPLQKDPMHEPE